jgi:putative ABC transport system substrate-binding protein
VDRRAFIGWVTGGVITAPCAAEAQQPATIPRIGFLAANLTAIPNSVKAFHQGLRDIGYVEGRNVVIEYRDAEGKLESLPTFAAQLAAIKVDVLVTFGGTLGALAARQATQTIPIVFSAVGDPVADGLVSSLARPGGNVTGLSLVSTELIGKWLELLRHSVPGINRIAILLKPDAVPDRNKTRFLKEADDAARALGVRLQVVEARGAVDFERAFSEMSEARAGALVVLTTPVFTSARRQLVDLAQRNRLPTMFGFREFVEAGGLMSYRPDLVDLARRTAIYMGRILKGAKASDLPVEQPTKFELVINRKAAKVLGLTIPQSVLARADEVFQ